MNEDFHTFSERYRALITGRFAGLNLTRITDREEFYNKQMLDSLLPMQKSNIFAKIAPDDPVLDVGFGGGFPLLPLAYLYPKRRFIGIEARRKKADAVAEIAKELGLNNVSTHHLRLQNLFFDRRCCVTFKAVAAISDLLLAIRGCAPVTAFFYKGPNVEQQEGKSMAALKNWERIESQQITVPMTDARHLIVYGQEKNYPRSEAVQTDVLLSSLL